MKIRIETKINISSFHHLDNRTFFLFIDVFFPCICIFVPKSHCFMISQYITNNFTYQSILSLLLISLSIYIYILIKKRMTTFFSFLKISFCFFGCMHGQGLNLRHCSYNAKSLIQWAAREFQNNFFFDSVKKSNGITHDYWENNSPVRLLKKKHPTIWNNFFAVYTSKCYFFLPYIIFI